MCDHIPFFHRLEVVFIGFRNYTKTTFGGRHRIKVMMGDLLLTSGLSSTRLKNSINFLVIFASGVVVRIPNYGVFASLFSLRNIIVDLVDFN